MKANVSSSSYLERSGIVQELPETDPNDRNYNYLFIYLGRASSKYQIELAVNHPVYAWSSEDNFCVPYYPYTTRADFAKCDKNYNDITETYATKSELTTAIGDISSALDAINGEVV